MNNSMKLLDERRREDELADMILGYLTEHPEASDTLEGIAGWWIMRQMIRVEVTKVEKALHRLAESNLLEKINKGNNPRYRLKAVNQEALS